jgi:lipoate-protein ligase A
MAADECLADEALRRDGLCLRFYGWETTTISLGAFQRVSDARACPAIAALPLVRRPSGGGAIVHGTDLTYAAAVPKRHAWGATPQVLYDAMHAAMVDVLRDHRVGARLWRGDAADGEDAPLFCFDRRAPGDVVVDRDGATVKLMGSAQRRLAAAVLQHGSLLLRHNPDVGGTAAHPGIAECVRDGVAIDARQIAVAWIGRLATVLGAQADEQRQAFGGSFPAAVAAARGRFVEEAWIARR